MAENERLDVLKNKRWLRLMRFIGSNRPEHEITRRLTVTMYRTLRSVAKQIPLEALLTSASEGVTPEFSRSVAECRHDFAEMIERVAAEPTIDMRSTICEKFVDAVVDRYLDQIGFSLVGQAQFATFDSYCAQMNRWKDLIRPELKRLAGTLESGKLPRVPAQSGATRAAEREELMGLSLLTGRVQRNGYVSGSELPDRSR